MDKDFNGFGGNVEAAAEIGKKVAAKALEKGINCFLYYIYPTNVRFRLQFIIIRDAMLIL